MSLDLLGLSILTTKKLHELYKRLNETLHRKNELEDKLRETTENLIKTLADKALTEAELAWRIGADYRKADGDSPVIDEGLVKSYHETRNVTVGQRRELTCSVHLIASDQLWNLLNQAISTDGLVEFRGLKWKIPSVSHSPGVEFLASGGIPDMFQYREVFLELVAMAG